jgi:dihydrofolate reductase / thymidylate synthase
MQPKINLIYSDTTDGIIGVNNDLYCKLSSDMKMFQKITSTKFNNKENAIIMGYNTWKSIGKPLKNRINIVISKNHKEEFNETEDVYCFESIKECLEYLVGIEYGKVFAIGGNSIFKTILLNYFENIDLIYHTEIMENIPNHILITNHDIVFSGISLPQYMINKSIENLKHDYKKEVGKIYDFTTDQYIEKEIHYTENVYQNTNNINHEEYQYLNIMKDILENGSKKDSRNSIVYSHFGKQMKFDLRNGFPLLTTKRVPWKTVLRELIWFINGSTDNRLLQEQNVHIWDRNSTKEFLKSRDLEDYEEGDLGPIYGFQWRHFGAEYVGHETDYSEKGTDQLQWIIDEIRNNPSSRRLIMSAWNPCDIDKMALPPCHVMVQFNIDGEYIDAQLYQRSGDLFLGVPFNIASYSFLLHIIGKITGYTPRYFIHTLGDTHIYENHIDAVNEQLSRIPSTFPKLIINEIHSIDEIDEKNFDIINYNYYPTIKAEMVA